MKTDNVIKFTVLVDVVHIGQRVNFWDAFRALHELCAHCMRCPNSSPPTRPTVSHSSLFVGHGSERDLYGNASSLAYTDTRAHFQHRKTQKKANKALTTGEHTI